MPRPVHFEIASDDPAKAQKFYSEVFGWKFDKWDGTPSPMDYWIAKTGDDQQPGINCGLMKKMPDQAYGIINYIAVPSVDDFSKKIQSNGGKIIMPKMPVPKVGYIAMCTDIDENVFGLVQIDETVKVENCKHG